MYLNQSREELAADIGFYSRLNQDFCNVQDILLTLSLDLQEEFFSQKVERRLKRQQPQVQSSSIN